MSLSRRDFIKVFGISLATSLLAGCRIINASSLPTLNPAWRPIRQKIRQCWRCFGALAKKASRGQNSSGTAQEDILAPWIAAHEAAIQELVAAGGLESPVADLIQEAYQAAVQYVWKSNQPPFPDDRSVTCYFVITLPSPSDTAKLVVEQSRALGELAMQGDINPATLSRMQAALEQDFTYYTLSPEEVETLSKQLMTEREMNEKRSLSPFPPDMEISPEAQAAARFLVELLATSE